MTKTFGPEPAVRHIYPDYLNNADNELLSVWLSANGIDPLWFCRLEGIRVCPDRIEVTMYRHVGNTAVLNRRRRLVTERLVQMCTPTPLPVLADTRVEFI